MYAPWLTFFSKLATRVRRRRMSEAGKLMVIGLVCSLGVCPSVWLICWGVGGGGAKVRGGAAATTSAGGAVKCVGGGTTGGWGALSALWRTASSTAAAAVFAS